MANYELTDMSWEASRWGRQLWESTCVGSAGQPGGERLCPAGRVTSAGPFLSSLTLCGCAKEAWVCVSGRVRTRVDMQLAPVLRPVPTRPRAGLRVAQAALPAGREGHPSADTRAVPPRPARDAPRREKHCPPPVARPPPPPGHSPPVAVRVAQGLARTHTSRACRMSQCTPPQARRRANARTHTQPPSHSAQTSA